MRDTELDECRHSNTASSSLDRSFYRMVNVLEINIPDEVLTSKIYFFRDQKVTLDRDLAKLYGVTTGNLNKAIKHNIKHFPEDFMFQLDKE